MNSVENIKNGAASLYWLAFLLTGHRDISIDVAAAVAASEGAANPFFAEWMRRWARRLVIAKALSAVHDELAASARRTESADFRPSEMPRGLSLSSNFAVADLECALFAIDLFPRAAIVLLVFEGVGIADAVSLLNASAALLKRAQAIGLSALASNLATNQIFQVSVPTRHGS